MNDFIELTVIPDDSRFGDIAILYQKTDASKRVMRKTKKNSTMEDFINSKTQAEEREKIAHDNILRLLDVELDEKNMVTSVYFEYPEDTVTVEELGAPKTIEMFRDIMSAVAYLQERKMVHGDLRPDYIGYSSRDRKFKLLDRLADISPPLQCQLNNINNYKALYMAPKIFDELLMKSKKIRQNSYKSEVFSLGFICLSAFESPQFLQEYYDFDNEKFAGEDFNEKLQNLCKRNYDNTTLEFIKLLATKVLVVDEKIRLTPSDVLDAMRANSRFSYLFDSEEIEAAKKRVPVEASVQYYNPFDFLKPEELINENKDIISIEGNKTFSTNIDHLPQSLIPKTKEPVKDHVPQPGDHKKYERRASTELEDYVREHAQPHAVNDQDRYVKEGMITQNVVPINSVTKIDLDARNKHLLAFTDRTDIVEPIDKPPIDNNDDDDEDCDMNAFTMCMDRPDTVEPKHRSMNTPHSSQNMISERLDTVNSIEELDGHEHQLKQVPEVNKSTELKNYSFKGNYIDEANAALLNRSDSDDQSIGDIGEQFKELGIEVKPEEREDSTLEKVLQMHNTSELHIYDEKTIKASVPQEKKSQVKFSDFLKQNTNSKRDMDNNRVFTQSKFQEKLSTLENITSPRVETKLNKETAIGGTFSFINPKIQESPQFGSERKASQRKLPNFGIMTNYSVLNSKNESDTIEQQNNLSRTNPLQQTKQVRYSNHTNERPANDMPQRSKSQYIFERSNEYQVKGLNNNGIDERYGNTERAVQNNDVYRYSHEKSNDEHVTRYVIDSTQTEQNRLEELEVTKRKELDEQRRLIEEANRIKEMEVQKRHEAEEVRIRQLEEEKRIQQIEIEAARVREEDRTRRLLQEEQRRQQETEKQLLVEKEKRRIAEDEIRRITEEENRRIMEEENRRKKLEAEKARLLEEEIKKNKQLEEEAKKQAVEDELQRKRLEEEANRKRIEDEAQRKRLEEEVRKRQLQEELSRLKKEEETQRRLIDEEIKRQQLAEDAQRRKNIESQQQLEEEESRIKEQEKLYKQQIEADTLRKRQEDELNQQRAQHEHEQYQQRLNEQNNRQYAEQQLRDNNESYHRKVEYENERRLQKIRELEDEKRRIQAIELDKQKLREIERAAEDKVRQSSSVQENPAKILSTDPLYVRTPEQIIQKPIQEPITNTNIIEPGLMQRGNSGSYNINSYQSTIELNREVNIRQQSQQGIINQPPELSHINQDMARRGYVQRPVNTIVPHLYTQQYQTESRGDSLRTPNPEIIRESQQGHLHRVIQQPYSNLRAEPVYHQQRIINQVQPQPNVQRVYQNSNFESPNKQPVSVKHVDHYQFTEYERPDGQKVLVKHQPEVNSNHQVNKELVNQNNREQAQVYNQSPVANLQLYNERAFENNVSSISNGLPKSTKWINSVMPSGINEPIKQYSIQNIAPIERKYVKYVGSDGKEYYKYE